MHVWPLSHDYIKQSHTVIKKTNFVCTISCFCIFYSVKKKQELLFLLVDNTWLHINVSMMHHIRSVMLLIFIVGIFHCMLHICLLFRYIMFYYRIIKNNDYLSNYITFITLSNTLYNFCWWCWVDWRREDWYEWYYTYRNAYNLK